MAVARRMIIDRQEWRVLGWLHASVGVGAIGGGIGLITGWAGMPTSYLDGTIFSSYVVPGLALAVLVGGSSLLAAWQVWRRSAYALDLSLLASVILAGWFAVQIAQVGLISWMQPFFIAVLVAQAGIAIHLRSRQP